MYRVVLSEIAARFYEAAQAALAVRLDRCFATIGADPRRHPNIKALRGALSGAWRFRLGDYRIVYQIDDARRLVTVMVIAHRREAY